MSGLTWMDGLLDAEREFKYLLSITSVDNAFDTLLDNNMAILKQTSPSDLESKSEFNAGRVDYACQINYLRVSGRMGILSE